MILYFHVKENMLSNFQGVMLSHDNLTWTAEMIVKAISWENETVLSYLPLSHIAGQLTDILVIPRCNGSVFIADKNALKGALVRLDLPRY